MERLQFLYYHILQVEIPIKFVSYTDEVFLKYKAICFTGGSKLDGRVSRACVFYEDEAKKNYFPVSIKG